jgi:transcription elongation factor GreA
MDKIPMTVKGAARLEEELQRLKTVDRWQVIEKIAEARALGDLKENADYHANREKQGFIEGRIQEIEGKLSNAQIIDPTTLRHIERIVFGATVTLENVDTTEIVNYQIVGEDEADLKAAKISITSPLARALISKMKGDIAVVNTPNGNIEYEVMDIQYA